MGSGISYAGAPKKVVIVGGGYGGVGAAVELLKQRPLEISIVCPNAFLDISWATPRAFAEPDTAHRQVVSFEDIFSTASAKNGHLNATHHQTRVTRVNEDSVVLENGDTLPFDVLIIATGSKYADSSEAKYLKPLLTTTSPAERTQELQDVGRRCADSRGILVVGAGFSGVEVAGELAAAHPEKPVKLVYSGSSIGSPAWPEKVLNKVEGDLRSLSNLELIPNTRASPEDAANYDCDVTFMCIGMHPNTAFLRDGALANALDDSGFVQTETTMQVKGKSNVFAIGDCAFPGNMPADRVHMSGFAAFEAAKKTLAPNVLRLLNGTPLSDVAPGRVGGVIVLHHKAAHGFMDKAIIPSFLAKMLKAKDYFRGQYRKNITSVPMST